MRDSPIKCLRNLFFRFVRFSVILLIGLLGTGCNASNLPLGTLEVRVWDHREAIGDFRELRLTLSAVAIHPTGQPRGEGWIEWMPSIQELDLTQYVAGQEAVITQAPIEAGPYNAVRLTVDRASGTLIDGKPVEVNVNFNTVALDFQISGGRTTILGLDLVVLDLSDHADQGYELQLREAVIKGNR